MTKMNLWLIARISILLINALGLPLLVSERTNFGIFGGAIGGAASLVVLFFWMRSHANRKEQLAAMSTPFWPMRKYPLAYWFTIGAALSIAAVVNLFLSIGSHEAVDFFGGILMLSAGIILAAVLANRFPVSMRRG